MASIFDDVRELAERLRKKTQQTSFAKFLQKPVRARTDSAAYKLASATPAKIVSQGLLNNKPLQSFAKAGLRATPLVKQPQRLATEGILSGKARAVPTFRALGRSIGKPQLGEDVGYATRGAYSITPFQNFGLGGVGELERKYSPQTSRQKMAERLGRAGYGTFATAPVGGSNYLANIASRGIQGAALGTGIGTLGTLATEKRLPKLDEVKNSALSGIENSWQLALTNLATDSALSSNLLKTLGKKAGFDPTVLVGKNITAPFAQRELAKGWARVISRALAEVPAENAFFTAIDKLSDKDKRKYTEAFVQNLPGNIAGNLLFAGLQGAKGTLDFKVAEKQAIKEAHKKAVLESLVDDMKRVQFPEERAQIRAKARAIYSEAAGPLFDVSKNITAKDAQTIAGINQRYLLGGGVQKNDLTDLRQIAKKYLGKEIKRLDNVSDAFLVEELNQHARGTLRQLGFANFGAKVGKGGGGQKVEGEGDFIKELEKDTKAFVKGDYSSYEGLTTEGVKPQALSLESIEKARLSESGTPAQRGQKIQDLKQAADNLKPPSDGSIPPETRAEIEASGRAVDRKVNLLDWFRTPDRVLKKIGLERESTQLKKAYNNYLDELPKEIGKVNDWYEQVKENPDASKRIFNYLDGKKGVELSPTEKKVAGEMQGYLKDWADRLGLPEDKRIASYITHIFDDDFIQKEFDPDLAKMISGKVPGSVYDPFLEKRLGKLGYKEDVFKALDAYVKRATRKVNMDPALSKLKNASERLDEESFNYVQNYASRINLRPAKLDNYIDNMVKQSPVGYKLGGRPTARVTRTLRRQVYRGALGLNLGSAIKNLTQGVNTYSQLGEKYTGIGYIKALREISTKGGELEKAGVLRDRFIQDRELSAVKSVMEKADKGLWVFFDMAEKINRGAAYFGAKQKALDEGDSLKQAVEKGIEMARKTQFTFGSVDTPVVMQSDVAKTLGQFQSFNIKQAEFLTEMVKSKEWKGMLRWLGANLLITYTAGKAINFDITDAIPFYGVFSGETKLGKTPPIQLAGGVFKAVTKAPDKYGNIPEGNVFERIANNYDVKGAIPAFFPAGVQASKTIRGVKAGLEGGSYSPTGRLQYPVEPDEKLQTALFGPYTSRGAKLRSKEDLKTLSDKQSEKYRAKFSSDPTTAKFYYDTVIKARKEDQSTKIYNDIEKMGYEDVKKEYPRLATYYSAEKVFSEYNKISKKDPEGRQAVLQAFKERGYANPEIARAMAKIKEMDQAGMAKSDRELLLFTPEVRAQKILDRFDGVSQKRKRELYDLYQQYGIITPEVVEAVRRLK